jgi:hypothetical protein
MKRFFLSIAVCIFVLTGMTYAAETETRTWTDENGVKHIVTITRETQKTADDSEQSTSAGQGSQELQNQTTKKQAAPETGKQGNRKTDNALPQGVNPNGSFQFDIDSHKPKF